MTDRPASPAEDLQTLAAPEEPFDAEHDPLDDVDPRLTSQLDELADNYGALGVLLVSASMWPDAANALIRRLADAPTPTVQPERVDHAERHRLVVRGYAAGMADALDAPAVADHHIKLTYAEWCERFVRIMPEPDNHHNAAECPYCRPRSRAALRG
jgi:hypothetical protein